MMKETIELRSHQRRHDGRTVIAHLSDLHFRATTDPTSASWTALSDAVAAIAPDVICVTGDLIDSALADFGRRQHALHAVSRYLREIICPAANVSTECLAVVPGNHDYLWQGVAAGLARTHAVSAFRSVFDESLTPRLFSNLRLALLPFDSNATDWGASLASGLVDERELVSFDKECLRISTACSTDWTAATRVALLHHHPMPLAATETREGLTDREEWLLLRNAGRFMVQMLRAQIDIVLHGHKHYPGVAKARFPQPDRPDSTITVVGAGSCGPGRPPSFCELTVYDDRTIELCQHERLEAVFTRRRPTFLVSYSEARDGLYRRLTDALGVRALRVQRFEEIMPSGDVVRKEYIEGMAASRERSVRQVRQTVWSQSGEFELPEVTECPAGQHIWAEWDPERRTTDTGRPMKLCFDPPLMHDSAVTFRRATRVWNAIHFNQRDRHDTGAKESTESVYLSVMSAYETYQLHIAFPPGRFPTTARVRVEDAGGQPTVHEQRYAQAHFLASETARTLTLQLERPLPGYIYRVEWDLPPNDDEDLGQGAGAIRCARDVETRLRASGNQPRVVEALRGLYTDLRGNGFGPTAADDELELELFVYDETVHGLRSTGGLNRNTTEVVLAGKTAVGRAYRRRDAVVGVWDGGADTAASIVEPGLAGEHYTVLAALPLFYPITGGRRVAIVFATSRRANSGLRWVDAAEGLHQLKSRVTHWYATVLASELGVSDFPGFASQ